VALVFHKLSHAQLQTCLLAGSCSFAGSKCELNLVLCGTRHAATHKLPVPRSAAIFSRAHGTSARALPHPVCGELTVVLFCRWEDPQDLASKARAYVDANWGAAHRLHHVHHA